MRDKDMWNKITDDNALKTFMESVDFFHDSCIKELSIRVELM